MPEAQGQTEGPELFIALVAAIGTDLDRVSHAVRSSLTRVNYTSSEIKLSELLHDLPNYRALLTTPEDKRLMGHMNAGDEFRATVGRGDAVALLAVGAIRDERKKRMGDEKGPVQRHAYILRSLKHQDELTTLRDIYGPGLFVLSAYSPRDTRLHELERKIALTNHAPQGVQFRGCAEDLIKRDQEDADNRFGQNVRNVFHLADVFIDASNALESQASITRFIDILFGYPYHTPTRDECGMFHAKAAALRSSALSRQVGAVISTADGSIVAVGTNEVPKSGGGLYWEGSPEDQRDFVLGYETNDRMQRNILAECLKALQKGNLLAQSSTLNIDQVVESLLTGELKRSQLKNLIEFNRAVHAEMATILDAAVRGVSVKGCTLYTTTFPCHDCAKHIVAADIRRVVYISPYPKSLAADLYPESIVVDSSTVCTNAVSCVPFVGIAPKRFLDLFEMVIRKNDRGSVINWEGAYASPRKESLPESLPIYYLNKEEEHLTRLNMKMREEGISPVQEESTNA